MKNTFPKVRTLAQIKTDPRVQSISDERNCESGIWVYFHFPYVDPLREKTLIHKDTIGECCEILNRDITTNPDLFNQIMGL